jgi:hypothetical protein
VLQDRPDDVSVVVDAELVRHGQKPGKNNFARLTALARKPWPMSWSPPRQHANPSAAPGEFMGRTDRILDPVERLSEILFGLIMALTVTGAVSVATADRLQIRAMVVAALGCNIAWGIIDAGMYLMARLAERGRTILTTKAIRDTSDPESARRIIADELPAPLASVLPPAQLDVMRDRIAQIAGFRRESGTDDTRLPGCGRRLHPRYPVHLSGRHSVHLYSRREACAASFECGRCRSAVPLRLPVRATRCTSAMDNRPCHGGGGTRSRQHCDRPRRLTKRR